MELITGIEKDNEEVDHAVAVTVPPIVIHDLESQIDPDISTDTVNISPSICLCLIFFLQASNTDNLKKVENVRFLIAFKNYIFGLTWTSICYI